ncbi:PREDICTED: disease resistance protein RPM1-like [Tarenaya hassleriana]|uniref:disease resistance protein RPM1-like n=1 Tax=Tarenaya hassleriana TaxID=28532 RepID=UPI00053C7276|nr:PREDICTED: disease resistance protein RPM1-like [Tarenaya hassleriana]
MASGLIDFGVGRILSVLENEVLQQTGFSDEIDAMKQKLRFMKSFLEQHGNTSSHGDKVFATFVKETRVLAYKIESIIDEFSYHVNRRRGQSWLKRAAHYPMYLQKRRSIACQLQAVKQDIQGLSESMSTFRPETSQGTVPPPAADGGDKNWVKNLQESSFFLKDDSLVGVDEAKEELTGWLLDPDSQRIVVTVVGMSGSGKTSLAGNIFRSRHVRKHFDSYAWVTISQSYSINNVLSTMIKEFTKETGLQRGTDFSSMEYRDLVEILVNYLQDKRYFLVFDDVWSIEFWKLICVALPDGIHGSRLMIITRDERVANFSYGLESRVHPVQPLSADKAWELFCNKAFPRNREQSISPNIELIARNLVHKSRGLPLAIVTLGSMMSTRRSESEWRKVENRLNWELSNNPELKDIHRILHVSFSDLPYPLKHCFLFSSIFPEDDKIEGKSLIRMWMAQGFVDSRRGVELEEVADGYLMELVYRNLLQVVSRNIHGRPKAFKMHDMVREVALIMSKEESLSLFSMDGELLPIDALSHTTKIEKLQLAGKLERLPSWFKTLHKLTRLSLGASSLGEDAMSCIGGIPNLVKLSIYNNAYEGDRLCFQEGFPCLKVLEVTRMRYLEDIVIAKGAMPHLQKLKIGYCRGVKRVPDGIESLTKLEKLSLSQASDELLERIRGENGIDRSKVNHIPIIKHVLATKNGISTEKLS